MSNLKKLYAKDIENFIRIRKDIVHEKKSK